MSTVASGDHLLDNVVWHALTGPHAGFAVGQGTAQRYLPELSMFAAVEHLDEQAWRDLTALAAHGPVGIFRSGVTDVPSWVNVAFRSTAAQMVAPASTDELRGALDGHEIVALDDADSAEMLSLVRLTQPGPFASRTHELGRFVGIRDASGALVAMAGERFRAPGWVEVSAVCTHPDHRGRGAAAALTAAVVRRVHSDGDNAFLHVRDGNDTAMRVYDHLGFTTRCMVDVVVVL